MDRFDLEKLESAITYVERIADGKNPVNNTIADSDDVMNDPIIYYRVEYDKTGQEFVVQNLPSML